MQGVERLVAKEPSSAYLSQVTSACGSFTKQSAILKMASTTLIVVILLLITAASAADPTCSTGLPVADVCCPEGCEKCGGPDCGARSREKKLPCCLGAIRKMAANCLTSGPPCKRTTKDPDFMAGSDIPDPTCERGLRKYRACCPPECSTCGGAGCKKRGIYIKSLCCPSEVKKGPRGCKDTGAPCLMFKKSKPTATVMPTPVETPEVEPKPEPEPVESPELEKEKQLPQVCAKMRTKFLAGCFCYLLISDALKVKRGKLFRAYCRKYFGGRKKISSLIFTCRRFSGPKAPEKVLLLVKRLNFIIPKCNTGLPRIREKL